MDDLDPVTPKVTPTAARPLLGLTVLAVEDSRFACDALRLLCQRSGARIRRADSLRSAERHLKIYRPSIAIIDLGLPDGSGADLIDELNKASPRIGTIIGSSGEEGGERYALAAGADAFLPKPIRSLASFQTTILAHLPEDLQFRGPFSVSDHMIQPDRLALRDDMLNAAEMLSDGSDETKIPYVAQFLKGIARSAEDRSLFEAAQQLAKACSDGRALRSDAARVAGMLQKRLTEAAPL